MGRWLARVCDTEKNSKTLGDHSDKSDKTPSGEVSSLLSLSPNGVFEKSQGGFVGFVTTSSGRFSKIQPEKNSKMLRDHSDKSDKTPSITPEARADALMATGLPREWAEPFARVLCGPPPGNFDIVYWERLLPGANLFADEWAAKAHALEWSAEEVFGLDEVAPATRWDRKGVAWLQSDGARVVAIDDGCAEIITRSGARLRVLSAKGKRTMNPIKPLTPRQNRFVSEYLKDLNATAAYKRAGYDARGKSAEVNAARLLGNAKVAAAVAIAMKERSRRTEITADRVLRELATIAFADIGDAFDEYGNPRPLHEMSEDVRRAITSLDVSQLYAEGENIGRVSRLRMADKIRALGLIGKHVGAFDTKVSIDSSGDALSLLVQSVQNAGTFKPVKVIEHRSNDNGGR